MPPASETLFASDGAGSIDLVADCTPIRPRGQADESVHAQLWLLTIAWSVSTAHNVT